MPGSLAVKHVTLGSISVPMRLRRPPYTGVTLYVQAARLAQKLVPQPHMLAWPFRLERVDITVLFYLSRHDQCSRLQTLAPSFRDMQCAQE